MSPKVALARMQAAGMKVGAAASSVDVDEALRALGNGGAQATDAVEPAPRTRTGRDGAKRTSAPPLPADTAGATPGARSPCSESRVGRFDP